MSETEMMIRGAIAVALGVIFALVTTLSDSPGMKAVATVVVVVALVLHFVTYRPLRQSRP